MYYDYSGSTTKCTHIKITVCFGFKPWTLDGVMSQKSKIVEYVIPLLEIMVLEMKHWTPSLLIVSIH